MIKEGLTKHGASGMYRLLITGKTFAELRAASDKIFRPGVRVDKDGISTQVIKVPFGPIQPLPGGLKRYDPITGDVVE